MLRVPVQTTFMILAVLLGALALPLVAGAIYQVIGTWHDRRRFPPSGLSLAKTSYACKMNDLGQS